MANPRHLTKDFTVGDLLWNIKPSNPHGNGEKGSQSTVGPSHPASQAFAEILLREVQQWNPLVVLRKK
jgi:hypothetical protein